MLMLVNLHSSSVGLSSGREYVGLPTAKYRNSAGIRTRTDIKRPSNVSIERVGVWQVSLAAALVLLLLALVLFKIAIQRAESMAITELLSVEAGADVVPAESICVERFKKGESCDTELGEPLLLADTSTPLTNRFQ